MKFPIKPVFTFALLAIFLHTACHNDEPETIVNKEFSLDLWSDWEFQQGNGYDSYVGIFTNGDEEIEVDYGAYGFGSIDNIVELPETVYFEEATIDGFPAKIRKDKYANGTFLSLYIDKGNGYDMCVLDVRNPRDDARYISIFKTFRFL